MCVHAYTRTEYLYSYTSIQFSLYYNTHACIWMLVCTLCPCLITHATLRMYAPDAPRARPVGGRGEPSRCRRHRLPVLRQSWKIRRRRSSAGAPELIHFLLPAAPHAGGRRSCPAGAAPKGCCKAAIVWIFHPGIVTALLLPRVSLFPLLLLLSSIITIFIISLLSL